MAVKNQHITDRWAWYNGDCIDGIRSTIKENSIHLIIYSPPFAADAGGLFRYSSSERDLSNARDYDEFMQHYEYVVRETHRVLLPGRMACVHCMDVPRDGSNAGKGLVDFPGDIIRMHERLGFTYGGRHGIWKEPLRVRNRTMAKGLAHKQVVVDSMLCDLASMDYLLLFRKDGTNPIPVVHPVGLTHYIGERKIPPELLRYRGWKGDQKQNRFSHWIWRQYASSFWWDIRPARVVGKKEDGRSPEDIRDPDDEDHMHPLQLDVIERCVIMRSNPGEVILTPFGGVASELVGAVINDRRAIGWELKETYWERGLNNLKAAEEGRREYSEETLFRDEENGDTATVQPPDPEQLFHTIEDEELAALASEEDG